MKKIVILAVAVFFAAGTVAAFAGETAVQTSKRSEKSLAQIVADSFKGWKMRDQDRVRDLGSLKSPKEVTVFQDMSSGIAKGSQEAKSETLRSQK